jgi:hypothetical protein
VPLPARKSTTPRAKPKASRKVRHCEAATKPKTKNKVCHREATRSVTAKPQGLSPRSHGRTLGPEVSVKKLIETDRRTFRDRFILQTLALITDPLAKGGED